MQRVYITLLYNRTAGEGISGVTRHTLACRPVLDDRAHGVQAAGADAWIGAALVHTGQVRRAVGTAEALGPAVGRTAEVVGQTGACRRTADIDAFRVGSAR